MRKTATSLAFACLAAAVAWTGLDAVVLGDTEAQIITLERPPAGPPRSEVVVAHSRWGHGSVSGRVRRTRRGWEVQLPRGTWIPCKRSCSEELRFATVDLWETQGSSATDGGPGYFRFDFWF